MINAGTVIDTDFIRNIMTKGFPDTVKNGSAYLYQGCKKLKKMEEAV